MLRWLVEGAVAWHKRASKTKRKIGLGPCVAIDAAVDKYSYDNDHASRFIKERLKVEVGAGKVGARDHFNIFSQWSDDNGFDDDVSENIFSRRMEERGLLSLIDILVPDTLHIVMRHSLGRSQDRSLMHLDGASAG